MSHICNTAIPRLEKSFDLIENVVFKKHPEAIVYSGDMKYNVNYIAQTCDCKDHYFRKVKCKHIYAVLLNVELQIKKSKHLLKQ